MNSKLELLINKADPEDVPLLTTRYLKGIGSMRESAKQLGGTESQFRSHLQRFWEAGNHFEFTEMVNALIRQHGNPETGIELAELAAALAGGEADIGHEMVIRDMVRYSFRCGYEIAKISTKTHVVYRAQSDQKPKAKIAIAPKRKRTEKLLDVIDILLTSRNKSPEVQLSSMLKAYGEPGKISAIRFGVNRKAETLSEISIKFSKTRERIRQICSKTAMSLFLTEQEVGFGPISMLFNAAKSACPAGSGNIDRLERVLECCGINQISVDGAFNLLSAIGASVSSRNGVYYVMDEYMTMSSFAFAVKRRERHDHELANPLREVSQIMMITKKADQNFIRNVAKQQKKSRGDLIASYITEELLTSLKTSPVQWNRDAHPDWTSGSLRIDSGAAKLIKKVAEARNVPIVSLLCAVVESFNVSYTQTHKLAIAA